MSARPMKICTSADPRFAMNGFMLKRLMPKLRMLEIGQGWPERFGAKTELTNVCVNMPGCNCKMPSMSQNIPRRNISIFTARLSCCCAGACTSSSVEGEGGDGVVLVVLSSSGLWSCLTIRDEAICFFNPFPKLLCRCPILHVRAKSLRNLFACLRFHDFEVTRNFNSTCSTTFLSSSS